MRPPILLAALAALAAALPSPPARACAPAPREGDIVRITDEAALIVWDPKTKTEHFIRRASFSIAAADFGFLVPTPERPELAEASGDILPELLSYTQPAHITKAGDIRVQPGCAAFMFLGRKASEEAPAAAVAVDVAPVRVLDEARVAGYDAVVLEADSASALSGWLKEHGYAEGASLTEWLRPYVTRKWKITAFKIAPDRPAQAVSTSAVRMTFTTEQPFFPYREPSDQRENVAANVPGVLGRSLRVFFIGPGRFDGAIGDAALRWPGQPRWSNRYERAVPWPFSLPEGAWLTDFVDATSPRPGTDDVYFSPAKDPSPIVPPPIVHTYPVEIPVPLELVAVAGAGAYLVVRARRRRAAKQ